jgi:competence protein ComEA
MFRATFTRLVAVFSLCAIVLVTAAATQGQTGSQTTARKSKAAPKVVLDLNKASAEELQDNLPGVGAVTAKKIVDGRPYAKVDDLAKAGVPARTIEAIRSMVRVGRAPYAETKQATAQAQPAAKVNLNSAEQTALETLPGIGPAHARAIIAGRPYRSVDDLARVKGLGKARIDELRELVTTTAPSSGRLTPSASRADSPRMKVKATAPTARATAKRAPGQLVNINTASKEELDALPGIGPVKAQAILDARPFKTIEDIMKVKGIKQGEFSKIKDLITVD